MKLSRLMCVCLVVLFVYTTSFSMPFAKENQKAFDDGGVSEEVRPFDFSDKFYEDNGIDSVFILNRRTGQDLFSVIDFINNSNHRGVRIIGTSPVYSFDGQPMYLNYYGEFFRNAFIENINGEEAMEAAWRYPIFTFPSTTLKGKERQSVLVDTRNGYFEKNPLGLGVVVLVEYTDRIITRDGQETLEKLFKRNGISWDGTPVIKTFEEIEELTRKGLVTQKVRGLDDETQPSYAIARVLQHPEMGAIAPDAFLMMATNQSGNHIKADQIFMDEFECLQRTGSWCSGKR